MVEDPATSQGPIVARSMVRAAAEAWALLPAQASAAAELPLAWGGSPRFLTACSADHCGEAGAGRAAEDERTHMISVRD